MGVIRKEDDTLHFTFNGVDQGEAAADVPAVVYGVVDLFAQAAQVTIVDHSGRVTYITTTHSCFLFSSMFCPQFISRISVHIVLSGTSTLTTFLSFAMCDV